MMFFFPFFKNLFGKTFPGWHCQTYWGTGLATVQAALTVVWI